MDPLVLTCATCVYKLIQTDKTITQQVCSSNSKYRTEGLGTIFWQYLLCQIEKDCSNTKQLVTV